jgi:hypothetical protein
VDAESMGFFNVCFFFVKLLHRNLGGNGLGFARGGEGLNCARELVARYPNLYQRTTTTIPKTFFFCSFLSDLLWQRPSLLISKQS